MFCANGRDVALMTAAGDLMQLDYTLDGRNPSSGLPQWLASEPDTRQRSQIGCARILIADDQFEVLEALRVLLKAEGYKTEAASNPASAWRLVQSGGIDLAILDLNYERDTTSGQEGLELISRIRQVNPTLPILILTAWASIELAVEAMRRGASDFVQKPWTNRQLAASVRIHLERAAQARRRHISERCEETDAIAIQQKLLPREFLQIGGLEIHGGSQPIQYIGGDSFRAMKLSDTQLALSLADVAGSGVPGALLTASLRAAEEPLALERLRPKHLCTTLNKFMKGITPEGKFTSFFCCDVDIAQRKLAYCNAGHNPPWIIRADGSSIQLNAGGAVLGVFDDWPYEDAEIRLQAGDRILLFTDGISEANSPEGEEFGDERIAQVATEFRHLDAKEIYNAILRAASEFCAGSFRDDASLIVIAVQ